MAKYIMSGDRMVDRDTGAPLRSEADRRKPFQAPQLTPTMPEYSSPIDGRMITTRHERREDLKRNNCVPYEPSLSPTKGKIRNKEFASRRGLQVSEEFR